MTDWVKSWLIFLVCWQRQKGKILKDIADYSYLTVEKLMADNW